MNWQNGTETDGVSLTLPHRYILKHTAKRSPGKNKCPIHSQNICRHTGDTTPCKKTNQINYEATSKEIYFNGQKALGCVLSRLKPKDDI